MSDLRLVNLRLVIGNRNYSSWSMRAWLALEQTGAPFVEEQIWFHQDEDRAKRREHSPAGRVPVLKVGTFAVWDSLAIGEYLAERFPDAGLWPRDVDARARARSLCAEMHAGFPAIRERMPLNCRARRQPRDRGPLVAEEVERVGAMWAETRREFGAGGAYLFGARSLADAFYAPVASRFRTYAVTLEGAAGEYAETVLAMPAVQRWMDAAANEEYVAEPYESMR